MINLGIFSFIEKAKDPSNKYAPPFMRKKSPRMIEKNSIVK